MTDKKPAKIFNDTPSPEDKFHFAAYAQTISDIIAAKHNETPLTIGIFGSWGTGKTSLMRLIKGNLNKYKKDEIFRSCRTVWFQAWKYTDEERILASLIEAIFRAMEEDDFFQAMKAKGEEICKSVSLRGMFDALSKFAGDDFNVTASFGKMAYKDKLSFLHTFDKFFTDLIYCYVSKTGLKVCKRQRASDQEGVLVVFIDDLDRCPKEKIPKVLEAVKLFLDKECCVFVIGADLDIINEALEIPYGEGADKFLEKIVQLPFILPRMDDDSGLEYLTGLKDDPILRKTATLLIASLGHNPRRIKRLVNTYNFMTDLAANRYAGLENPLEPEQVLRWLIIEAVYPGFTKLVRHQSWTYVPEIQKNIQQLEEKMTDEEKNAWRVDEEKLKESGTIQNVAVFLKDRHFVSIVRGLPSEEEKIKQLISFTASMPLRVQESSPASERDHFDLYTKIIPRGSFTLAGSGETIAIKKTVTINEDYEIGIYPVTNNQYKRFYDAGGYNNDAYWTPAGLEWRGKERITAPLYWMEERWNKPDYPVVGVSWYEVQAYCNWLSVKENRNYHLPTEAQWEKAASWDEEKQHVRIYPWGDQFDQEKCNTAELESGGTTSVERYPQGRSPYGCHDMAGNVWEWTDNWFDKDSKVLHGGSWHNSRGSARCASSYGYSPSYRLNYVGFRCSRTKK